MTTAADYLESIIQSASTARTCIAALAVIEPGQEVFAESFGRACSRSADMVELYHAYEHLDDVLIEARHAVRLLAACDAQIENTRFTAELAALRETIAKVHELAVDYNDSDDATEGLFKVILACEERIPELKEKA